MYAVASLPNLLDPRFLQNKLAVLLGDISFIKSLQFICNMMELLHTSQQWQVSCSFNW